MSSTSRTTAACLPTKRPAEGRFDGVRRVLDAVDQVVGVLAFEALVERECLQAREAADVGVLDALGRHPVFAEQLGADLGDLVQVEDDRRVGDVERRDPARTRSHAMRRRAAPARTRSHAMKRRGTPVNRKALYEEVRTDPVTVE